MYCVYHSEIAVAYESVFKLYNMSHAHQTLSKFSHKSSDATLGKNMYMYDLIGPQTIQHRIFPLPTHPPPLYMSHCH